MIKEKLQHAINTAVKSLQQKHQLPADLASKVIVERSHDRKFGDFTSNVALLLAKAANQKPRELAQLIVNNLAPNAAIETIEIAGAGFINFYLTEAMFLEIIKNILEKAQNYGKLTIGAGKRANVEFVSANPTGPLHVGHGRGMAYGDVIANLLQATGYQVDREYYVNDAGRQMHILAVSVWLRYLSLFQDLPNFPSNGYKGDYIAAIAKDLQKVHGDSLLRPLADLYKDLPKDTAGDETAEVYIDLLIERAKLLLGERNYSLIFEQGLQTILADIKQDLSEFGVEFQQWFMESSLVTKDHVHQAIELLKKHGHLYKKDGALWFKATLFGDEKDRVLIKENGQTTYFASDIAYHLNKYERGYAKIIDVLGADHHGYAPRINAFLQALNLDTSKFNVLLVQFAILYRSGVKAQMSTRSGEFVTLRDLRNEIGKDAARFFYVMRKNDQHLDFDLDLAKSQSMDNPVYYIQYAYARICSVFRQATTQQINWQKDPGLQNLHLLNTPQESNLIYVLHNYLETIQNAAENYAPHLLTHYLLELATSFHAYYNAHRFLDVAEKLRDARLSLILAVQQILANGLQLLGIATLEEM